MASRRCRIVVLPFVLGTIFVVLGATTVVSPAAASGPQTTTDPQNATDEELRADLRSGDPADWVQPLQELLTRAGSEDATGRDSVSGVLRAFVTSPLAEQNADRTRFILKHKLMRTQGLGDELLLELQLNDSGLFLSEIEGALRKVVRDGGEERGKALLEKLLADPDSETFPLAFPPVFSIVASELPRMAVATAVAQVSVKPNATISRSLQTFLRLSDPPENWADWWQASEKGLLPDLLERFERSQWLACAQLLRSDHLKFRDWLLISLGEGTPSVRSRLALAEMATLIESLKGNGGVTPPKIEILKPLVARLVDIAASGDWPVSQRLRALRRLEEMAEFLRSPELHSQLLEESLVSWMGALSQSDADPNPRQAKLGLEAVRAVGILGIRAGAMLDGLLSRTLVPGWDSADDELVTALLTSLRQLGPRPETVGLMSTVFEHPRAKGKVRDRVLAVQVLNHENVRGFSDTVKTKVANFYRSVLADKDAGEPRRYAIIYLGNLGLPEAVDDLRRVVTEAGAVTDADRSAAVGAISEIGGTRAAKALRELFQTLSEGTLLDEVRANAVALCSKDEELELLSAFVTDGKTRMPWYEPFLAEEKIRDLLNPDKTSTIRSTTPVQERWNELRLGQCEVMLTRIDAIADASDQEQGYRQLESAAREVIRFVESLAPEQEHKIALESFREYQERGRARAEILAALSKKEVATCLDIFSVLASGGSNGGTIPIDSVGRLFNENVQWLMRRLQAQGKFEGEKQLLDGLRALADKDEKIQLDPTSRELLDAIEKRHVDGGERHPNKSDS